MRNIERYICLALLLCIAASCKYPHKYVVLRWKNNGRPRMVRWLNMKDTSFTRIKYTKKLESTSEKLFFYYENGKKESMKRWKGEFQVEEIEWYRNGKEKYHRVVKNLIINYSPYDSLCQCVRVRKSYETYFTEWDSTGRVRINEYPKNGKVMRAYYDKQCKCLKDSVYRDSLKISFTTKFYTQ